MELEVHQDGVKKADFFREVECSGLSEIEAKADLMIQLEDRLKNI